MSFLAGKFARFTVNGVSTNGSFKWGIGFKRDRLDTTNFESVASSSNVFSEGLTGVLDTTVSVDGYLNDLSVNVLWPDAVLASVVLLLRKNVALGYYATNADVLSFSPNTTVRDKAGFSCEIQTNGLVTPAT